MEYIFFILGLFSRKSIYVEILLIYVETYILN